MSTPLVSVLMPVYNAGVTLDETLASLEAQTLTDFEIVAVDDGSQDNSAEILAHWEQRDHRLRPIRTLHAGLIPALNLGLAHCRGRYVARMDADDLVDPQRLEKQVALLQAHPEISVAGCLVETFPREEVGQGFLIYEEWLNGLIEDAQIAREIFIESPIVHPSAMMYRQHLVDLQGYQDKGWAEDYDLWLRYYTAGHRFAKVPQVLLYWREHPSRMTHTDGRYSIENFLRAKAHYLLAGPLKERDALFIWGAGKTGRRLSKHLIRGGCRPEAFIDIAPAKIGKTMRGVAIVDKQELAPLWAKYRRPLLVAAVASRGARQLIREELGHLGLVEGVDFLCAA
jgi:glycosyltransferase involved in cell wall biosynthesis